MRLVDEASNDFASQVFYLDFDGARSVWYDGPVRIEGLTVDAFKSPEQFAGEQAAIVSFIVSALNQRFGTEGVSFTTTRPSPGSQYSTIYIGGTDRAFSQYGSFLGLAEKVDVGNQDPTDEALVFSEEIWQPGITAQAYAAAVADVIGHEAKHLLGYEHGRAGETGFARIADANVAGAPNWQPAGPQPVTGGQAELGANDQVSGSITKVIVHPTKPNVVYVGTTDGGVWRSLNATAASPTWTPLTDQFPSLAIGALTFDTTNPNIVYAGTGNFSTFFTENPSAAYSIGIIKITESPDSTGAIQPSLTKAELFGNYSLGGRRITSLVVNGDLFVVATDYNSRNDQRFLFRKTKDDTTFQAIRTDDAGTPLKPIHDLVVVPSSATIRNSPNMIMYLGVGTQGVFRSQDSGDTWTLINDNVNASNNDDLERLDGRDRDNNGTNDNVGDDISASPRIKLAIFDNRAGATAVYAALLGPTTATFPVALNPNPRGAFIFRSQGTGPAVVWQSMDEPSSTGSIME